MAAGGLLAAGGGDRAGGERRRTFTVDSLADNGDGNCQDVPAAGDGFCTLRDAINAANNHLNSLSRRRPT